jgi:hypothetical protein
MSALTDVLKHRGGGAARGPPTPEREGLKTMKSFLRVSFLALALAGAMVVAHLAGVVAHADEFGPTLDSIQAP